MAEFPTYEQMAKNVAEKALDEILYDGKSIREWVKLIIDFDKTIEDIKAEIKEETRFCPLTEGLERAMEIIDKYTAESEG